MSVEELLKPRYKVIAGYPDNEFDVGEILFAEDNGDSIYYGDMGRVRINLKNYPHLFKKLEWYEDREESEMPKFVKIQNSLTGLFQDCKKVKAYLLFANVVEFDDGEEGHISFWLPSTLEEYDSFIKLKK